MAIQNDDMRRALIGQIEVDSGKVMIIDPDWIRLHNEQWRFDKTQKAVTFWGQGAKQVAKMLEVDGFKVITETEGEDDDEHSTGIFRIEADELEELQVIEKTIRSYSEIIKENVVVIPSPAKGVWEEIDCITSGEDMAGELGDAMAVVFDTLICGGIYNVFATYKQTRRSGERIAKIEIDLVDDRT